MQHILVYCLKTYEKEKNNIVSILYDLSPNFLTIYNIYLSITIYFFLAVSCQSNEKEKLCLFIFVWFIAIFSCKVPYLSLHSILRVNLSMCVVRKSKSCRFFIVTLIATFCCIIPYLFTRTISGNLKKKHNYFHSTGKQL